MDRRIVLVADAAVMTQHHMREYRNVCDAWRRAHQPVTSCDAALGQIVLDDAECLTPFGIERSKVALRAHDGHSPSLRKSIEFDGREGEPADDLLRIVGRQPLATMCSGEVGENESRV